MENIWSESYKNFREPYFEIEDPYTELNEEKCKDCGKDPCECDEAGEDQEHKYKKSGKKSKDYDKDGEVEDESDEYAGVKDRAIKKAMKMKEEYNASKKIKSNDKIDVKSGINNKINTSPTIPEEFYAWIDELISEGYNILDCSFGDLMEFYVNGGEMYLDEEYIDEEEMQSKSALAQKKIRKERADLELAKEQQKTGQMNTESVLNYLNNRYELI